MSDPIRFEDLFEGPKSAEPKQQLPKARAVNTGSDKSALAAKLESMTAKTPRFNCPKRSESSPSQMRTRNMYPEVETRFLITRWTIHTLVLKCPFCGGQHRHGASGLGGDPRQAFEDNRRGAGTVSHCSDYDRGTYRFVASGLPAIFEDRTSRRRWVVRHLEELGIPYCDEFLIKPRPRRRRRYVW
jgi:hypothetical protein